MQLGVNSHHQLPRLREARDSASAHTALLSSPGTVKGAGGGARRERKATREAPRLGRTLQEGVLYSDRAQPVGEESGTQTDSPPGQGGAARVLE